MHQFNNIQEFRLNHVNEESFHAKILLRNFAKSKNMFVRIFIILLN